MEVFFPNPPNLTEAQAASLQTFLHLDQNRAALLHLVELAKNDNPRPQTNTDIKRPERGKIQNNSSTQQNTNMGSHKKTQKPRARSVALSRPKHRGRLSEIVNKQRLESNNNQQGHPLLDKDGYNGDREPDPRGRNGDSSDDDYKEDPFNLWALRQRQLNYRDPSLS